MRDHSFESLLAPPVAAIVPSLTPVLTGLLADQRRIQSPRIASTDLWTSFRAERLALYRDLGPCPTNWDAFYADLSANPAATAPPAGSPAGETDDRPPRECRGVGRRKTWRILEKNFLEGKKQLGARKRQVLNRCIQETAKLRHAVDRGSAQETWGFGDWVSLFACKQSKSPTVLHDIPRMRGRRTPGSGGPRTTKLHDRRQKKVTRDLVDRLSI